MVGCRCTSALLAALLLLPVAAAAERVSPVGLAGESRSAAARLEEARKHIAEKEWADAIADLQSLLGSSADDLVPVEGGRSVQVRLLCHLQLATLPTDALQLYRSRVDPQADRWLESWTRTREDRWLRKIVDEAFCSRAGARALELLGDLAFERGSFTEAEGWWRMLAPLPSADGKQPETGTLRYPGPLEREKSVRPALEARQLLARLFVGHRPDWPGELAAFRARHGRAEGSLAGRKGCLADLLQALAAERRQDPPPHPSRWPTFAGNGARSFVAPVSPRFLEELSRLCRGGPTWIFDLEKRKRVEEDLPEDRDNRPNEYARKLAFQPALVGPHALVSDGRHVTAFDLRTGTSSDWYDAVKAGFPSIDPSLKLPAPPDLVHTLTVADGCVFARLGVQTLGPGLVPAKSESLLVCLALEPGAAGKRVLWEKQPRVNPRDNAIYEGAPVVAYGRVYIAVTRYENGRSITAVECYPARPEDSSPPTLWHRDLCDSRELRTRLRTTHQLLTLAGPNIVYCSHNGALVALDAHTGRHAWGLRYPRRKDFDDKEAPRGLLPCVYAEGRVYAAPADSDRLLCLDAITGKVLWSREGMTVTHLLGVGQGRLIFTEQLAGELPRGEVLRAVGAEDGSDAAGWMVPDSGGGLPSRGRGLLAGDLVLWPTARKPYGVFAFRQRDGLQPDNPALLHRVPAGNLVYANGCLLVAGQRTLSVYVSPALRADEHERKAEREPDAPAALLDRGRSEADAGLLDRAQATLARAESLAISLRHTQARRASEGKREEVLPPSSFLLRWVQSEAQQERQRVLLAMARRAARHQRPGEIEKTLTLATSTDFGPRARLRALAEAAQLRTEADQPERAAAAWQSILDSAELRPLPVEDVTPAGERVARAGEWAATAIEQLRREHGGRVYEAVEQRARQLADRPDENAERLVQEFPNAAVTRAVLIQQARRAEEDRRPTVAARAYRRLLALPGNSTEKTAARSGLARVRDQTAPAPADLELPLLRTWQAQLAPDEHVLPVAGDVLLSAHRHTLVCRTGEDGKVCWRQLLPFAPSWASVQTDLILAGGEAGAACLERADGKILWTFAAPPQGDFPGSAREGGGHAVVVASVQRPAEPLSDFRVDAGRLFCLQGQRRLLALDVDTGRLLWQRWASGAALRLPAPHGRFTSAYHAGSGNVLIQTTSGRRWLLGGATGTLLHDTKTDPQPWAAPVVLDESSVCLVPDGRRVVRIDLATGKETWSRPMDELSRESGQLPQLIGPRGGLSGARTECPLLLLSATNIGYLLQRLDPATGKSLWSEPRLLSDQHLDARGWTVDGRAVYAVRADRLEARALADGKVLWQQPLGPECRGGAYLCRWGDSLLVRPICVEKVQLRFRWLNRSVQWVGGVASNDRGIFSVVFCDPGTGQVIQRLNALPQPVAAATRHGRSRSLSFLPDLSLQPVWSEEGAACVQTMGHGLLLAFGGRAWGLKGGK